MTNKIKLLAVTLVVVILLTSVFFSFFAAHTYKGFYENSSVEESVPLFKNYTGSIISETVMIKNAPTGILNPSMDILIVSPLSYYPVVKLDNNITNNSTLLNCYGPVFTLEAVLQSALNPNDSVLYGGIGGFNGTNNIVGTTFGGILWDGFGFRLHAVPIKISGGNYTLHLLLYMNTSFPVQNSSYLSLNWGIRASNLTITENVNGYLFKSSPEIGPVNVTKYFTTI